MRILSIKLYLYHPFILQVNDHSYTECPQIRAELTGEWRGFYNTWGAQGEFFGAPAILLGLLVIYLGRWDPVV